MKQLLGILLIVAVFQSLFSVMLKFPVIGFLCYVAFLLFAWWKMRQLNNRSGLFNRSANKTNSTSISGNVIDVEYTEKEIND